MRVIGMDHIVVNASDVDGAKDPIGGRLLYLRTKYRIDSIH